MKEIVLILCLIFMCACVFSACGNTLSNNMAEVTASPSQNEINSVVLSKGLTPPTNEADSQKEADLPKETKSTAPEKIADVNSIKIKIGNDVFNVTLKNNPTAQAFAQRLPMSVNMEDLNGNEKFYFMEEKLVSDAQNVEQINTGDIMLYGSDCLVLFYKTFTTQYSYTPIGSVDDISGFTNALGKGSVTVNWSVD